MYIRIYIYIYTYIYIYIYIYIWSPPPHDLPIAIFIDIYSTKRLFLHIHFQKGGTCDLNMYTNNLKYKIH